MKPSRIMDMLDIAWKARQLNQVWNPLFIGSAGIGKSAIVRQWCKKMDEQIGFKFIDVRGAYYEAPDLVGVVDVVTDEHGRKRTSHILPDKWPTEGNGIILLEEPNRATTGVMNCLMQLLQEREIGTSYKIPDGWMIVGCINPDDAAYDVNTMDTALMNRFVPFEIEYDHNTFINYMQSNNWCEHLQAFIRSAAWVYKDASAIGQNGKYISPRTWEQVNSAHKAGAINDPQLHRSILHATLGKDLGNALWAFIHDDAPVTASDLLSNRENALKKLKKQSSKEHYAGDKLSVTVESIEKVYGGRNAKTGEIDEDTMVQVASIIPSDQALILLKKCGSKSIDGNAMNFFKGLCEKYPNLANIIRQNVRLAGT